MFAEDAMHYANRSRKRAQDAIDAVRNAGILTQVKQGRKYVYTIDPDVWPDMIDR